MSILLTDGGLETTLIFHEGLDLPHFAAYVLLDADEGRSALRRYYDAYLTLAEENGTGFVLESPTWRANPDWEERIGSNGGNTEETNRSAIRFLDDIRQAWSDRVSPILVSGCVGPREDGYVAGEPMAASDARSYHRCQLRAFAAAGADMARTFTMTYPHEAVGIAQAAQDLDLAITVGFTVETDGRLPSGTPLSDAIQSVDAATDGYPDGFMINCAHPTHVLPALEDGSKWTTRITDIRANASRKSHEELDAAPTLDEGDPADLAQQYRQLQRVLPNLRVIGGCCGTDPRHLRAILEEIEW